MTEDHDTAGNGRVRRWFGALILLALAGLAVSSSVWTVRQDETGLVLRWGKIARAAEAGMHFTLPWPVETLVKVPTQSFWKPIGYVVRDRARNLPPTEEQSQWLTGDTNIVELQATVNFVFTDPQAYLFGVADYSDGSSNDTLIRDAVESSLTEFTAGMAIDDVLSSGKIQLQLDVQRRAQELLDAARLGATITGVNITAAAPPARVREAFTEVQSARADRERRISEADGYARRMLPDARAKADRMVREAETYATESINRAKGEADRFNSLLAEVRRNPELARRRLWLDALGRILAQGKKVVYQPNEDGRKVRLYLEQP